jgi:fucose permease
VNKNIAIKASLFINYFVFAILLNSVGIVILKSQEVYGVDELQASTLELFKDLPIAIVSFLIASFLPRIGYKIAMLASLAFVSLACIGMYFGNSFGAATVVRSRRCVVRFNQSFGLFCHRISHRRRERTQ